MRRKQHPISNAVILWQTKSAQQQIPRNKRYIYRFAFDEVPSLNHRLIELTICRLALHKGSLCEQQTWENTGEQRLNPVISVVETLKEQEDIWSQIIVGPGIKSNLLDLCFRPFVMLRY